MSDQSNSEIYSVSYSASWKEAWDEFVITKSRNGTIFHERNFLEYHPEERFDDASLLFLKKKTNPPIVVGVFPAALSKKGDTKILSSHPGSSYGGLVYSPAVITFGVSDIIEQIVDHAGKIGAGSIEIRLPENIIFADPPDQEFSFLLWHRGFRLKTRELSSAVFLQSEIPLSILSKKTYSWSVNRAKSEGITVSYDISIEKVYPLIQCNLETRYEKSPTHTLAELKELKSRYPDRIKAWTAMKAETPVAVVVVFEVNSKAVHDFYIAQDYNHTKAQPLYLIFDSIFDYYRENNFHWFNFGISSRDKWIKWGILKFKEGLGGRGVVRETWILDDVDTPKPDDSPPH